MHTIFDGRTGEHGSAASSSGIASIFRVRRLFHIAVGFFGGSEQNPDNRFTSGSGPRPGRTAPVH